MEKLKDIKCTLVSQIQSQLTDIKHTNTKELGEVIDMIKDLEEAMYYCAIIEAMEESKKEKEETPQSYNNINYYMEPYYNETPNATKKVKYINGYLYGSYGTPMPDNPIKEYTPYMEYAPYMMRNKEWNETHMYNEGQLNDSRSMYSRRMYMDSKKNKAKDTDAMEELEHYVKDLGDDLTDMIQNSSPEEKQVLSQKLQMLASKVNK